MNPLTPIRHRGARELAATLQAQFGPQALAVIQDMGDHRGYEVTLYFGGSVLRTSSLVDALNFVVWCERGA